jgi:methanogenic corrinoid protein MtbC1
MDEVGRDFKAGDLFVPEVLIAARAMHAGMNSCARYWPTATW